MRFGKRLAEVVQRDAANLPYVRYKDLKHTVGEVSKIIQEGGLRSEEDEGASSGEEAPSEPIAEAAPVGSKSSSEVACIDVKSTMARLEGQQQEFFNQIDSDIHRVVAQVQNSVASLEAALGELQLAAINAGLLFTPKQLEEIAAHMPFEVHDNETIAKWVHSLHPTDSTRVVSHGLIEKYGNISLQLNRLLQYVEVNLTAVRKILKKFEKKVPGAVRTRHAHEYKAHHELLMPALRHILITSGHMQHLIIAACPQVDAALQAIVHQGAHIGPESHAVLSKLRGLAHLDEVLGPPLIDVYAKPNADAGMPQGRGTQPQTNADSGTAQGRAAQARESTAVSVASASVASTSSHVQAAEALQASASSATGAYPQVPVFVGGSSAAKGWQQSGPMGHKGGFSGNGKGFGADGKGCGRNTQDRGGMQAAGGCGAQAKNQQSGRRRGGAKGQKQGQGNKGCAGLGKGFGADGKGCGRNTQDRGGVQGGGCGQAMAPAVNVQWYGQQGGVPIWS